MNNNGNDIVEEVEEEKEYTLAEQSISSPIKNRFNYNMDDMNKYNEDGMINEDQEFNNNEENEN